MTWQCFLVEPSDRERRSLRRYAGYGDGDRTCAVSEMGYHNAESPIEDGPCERDGRGYISQDNDWPRDDPRWPTHCACGYAFAADDEWQLFRDPIYVAPDGSEHVIHGKVAPGLMVDAFWLHAASQYAGRSPDGRVLMLYLPDGYSWIIDGPSSNGDGWQRTGPPPLITARPSILSPGYHGWLTDGVLSDDLDGRSYPAIEARAGVA